MSNQFQEEFMFVSKSTKHVKTQAGNSDKNSAAGPKAFRPAPSHEQISQRAYEIYQSGGYTNGRDQQDWYKAEREMCAPRKN
jgi:Protein of unknown function (DUF2934)